MSGGEERCGARTKAGGRCQWPAGECPWHGRRRRPPVPTQQSERSLPRDPAAMAWWTIGEVVAGRLDPRAASVVAALLRVLTKLESNELPAEAATTAALLRGRLLHGVPPATPEEWALAASLLDAAAMAELRRWALPEGSGQETGDGEGQG